MQALQEKLSRPVVCVYEESPGHILSLVGVLSEVSDHFIVVTNQFGRKTIIGLSAIKKVKDHTVSSNGGE